MGIIYSHNNFELNEEADTLCFNADIFESDTSKIFYKIISNIENLFNTKCNNKYNINFLNNIHIHFEINNCLFEIKLSKEEKMYSLGYVKTRIKLFTQKNDTINKEKFYNLCHHIDI
jgi:hypothetical protein